MAQSLTEFTNAVITAMVANSRYPILAGEPMPDNMTDEMEDSMQRLADPIYAMVLSFALEPGTIESTYQVKANLEDPIPGYLGAKIDGNTLMLNEDTYKIYVANVPLASYFQTGGIRIGTQPYLYLQGSYLTLNADTTITLSGGVLKVPTSYAVKKYVDNAILAAMGGGGGDMFKSTYDSDDSGIVDDSEMLGGELPSYYLAWANFTGKPTTVAGYGITDAYTKIQIDNFFEGESSGKKQVHWDRVLNKPTILNLANAGSDRIITSISGADLNGEVNLTFNGTLLTITGNETTTGYKEMTEMTAPSAPAANKGRIFAEDDTLGTENDAVLKYIDENSNEFRLSHKRYVHVQSSASTTWTINHNLGAEPNVMIYDDGVPPNKLLGPITHTTINQVTISLPISVSGKAICLI